MLDLAWEKGKIRSDYSPRLTQKRGFGWKILISSLLGLIRVFPTPCPNGTIGATSTPPSGYRLPILEISSRHVGSGGDLIEQFENAVLRARDNLPRTPHAPAPHEHQHFPNLVRHAHILKKFSWWKRKLNKVRGNGDFSSWRPPSQYRAVLAQTQPPLLHYLAGAGSRYELPHPHHTPDWSPISGIHGKGNSSHHGMFRWFLGLGGIRSRGKKRMSFCETGISDMM